MKKILLICFSLSILRIGAQSLPPTAQALYTEFYNSNVTRGQYAVTNGAQALASADGNTFYLKWFPAGATPSLTPLLVTMHGTTGNAFDEFYLWHQHAAAKGVGIIAIQWYRGAASVTPNDYFDDPVIYSYIDTSLKRIHYPSNKAFLHGFSRGSARSYAIAFYDTRPTVGKNYFCTVMSNSGKADSLYPLYNQINTGMYGHALYTGKRWGMFCGGLDPSQLTNCTAMNNSRTWVTSNGGNVGLYISDPSLPHGGFHQTPAYIDSALNYYLPCFNGTLGVKENKKSDSYILFPNPANDSFTFKILESILEDKITIYNTLGKLIYQTNFTNEITIDSKNWEKGIYFYETKNNLLKGKIIIQ